MGLSLTDHVSRVGLAAGANAVGVASVETFERERATLQSQKANGMSGPLHFTYDDPRLASDIRASFPWANSLVVFGVEYASRAPAPMGAGPTVARFATADHYRPVRSAAEEIADALIESGARAEIICDDNRLLDRAAAVRAGIGWRGRSTMVLNPAQGPWMLLGTVVTDAVLEPTSPMRRDWHLHRVHFGLSHRGHHGQRTRCPTLSIHLATDVRIDPLWIRPKLGRRIYGCDDCLTSCPPGFKTIEASQAGSLDLSVDELLGMSDSQLVERFPWWFIPHRDGRYLRRNLLVAAGNSGEPEVLDPIEKHLTHRHWDLLADHGPTRDHRPSSVNDVARHQLSTMSRDPTGELSARDLHGTV